MLSTVNYMTNPQDVILALALGVAVGGTCATAAGLCFRRRASSNPKDTLVSNYSALEAGQEADDGGDSGESSVSTSFNSRPVTATIELHDKSDEEESEAESEEDQASAAEAKGATSDNTIKPAAEQDTKV